MQQGVLGIAIGEYGVGYAMGGEVGKAGEGVGIEMRGEVAANLEEFLKYKRGDRNGEMGG